MKSICSLCLVLLSYFSLAKVPIVGAERTEAYLPFLKNNKVGLIVNQTAQVKSTHLVDFLVANEVDVQTIFSPEHGFRGDHDAGALVKNNIDKQTGIPIISLYGKNKYLLNEQLKGIDSLIFDIQDVGVRFYTYISTMHYAMKAAAETGTTFIVLDRPNPNLHLVDGPILNLDFKSFVGVHPIPVLHGLTVGELAKMIVGEGWLETSKPLDLKVITMKNYSVNSTYTLPIKPSPNLPNMQAITLYPSLCFFEATNVSIGRGTDHPFQIYGASTINLGEFSFTPQSIKGAASKPKGMNVLHHGNDLRKSSVKGLELKWFIDTYREFKKHNKPFYTSTNYMDKLSGSNKLRLDIEQGKTWKEIKASWKIGLTAYKKQRQPYLLYER